MKKISIEYTLEELNDIKKIPTNLDFYQSFYSFYSKIEFYYNMYLTFLITEKNDL